jgi:hypothetical protein
MNTQTLPSVGSVVSVTTKHHNTYYFTYKEKPFDYRTYVGVVVKNDKWLEANYLSVRTDNPNYPISQISVYNIEKIEVIKGSLSTIQQFPVASSKGTVYNVTKKDDHFSCECTGFKYYSKCKHIELVRNDYYE